MRVFVVVLAICSCFVFSGCSLKFTGEMTMMEQWSKPVPVPEAVKSLKTVETTTTTKETVQK